MFNENDLESVYVVGQEINDRNLGETEESDTEHTSGNLSYFYCGGIAAGLQQNFITFSLHFGGWWVA